MKKAYLFVGKTFEGICEIPDYSHVSIFFGGCVYVQDRFRQNRYHQQPSYLVNSLAKASSEDKDASW